MTSNRPIRFVYDDAQSHQLDAIDTIVDLFADIPSQESGFMTQSGAVGNLPGTALREYDSDLSQRYGDALARNGLPRTMYPEVEFTTSSGFASFLPQPVDVPHFSIEMETGTGKTYVYLRTIYALRKRYGFGKYVIVVPSVAIYEGVRAAFQSMRGHLAALYGNEVTRLIEFDSDKLSDLREYESNQSCDILLMTVDSFNKQNNRIYRMTDKLPGGRYPISYIQSVQPIVILDEPQNMESELAQQAIHTLNPLCVLRFSATHRDPRNLVYRLTPFDALRLGLVKQVHVLGLVNDSTGNAADPVLRGINRTNRTLKSASLEIPYLLNGTLNRRVIEARVGEDLYARSSRFDPLNGWRVSDFGSDANGDYVSFTNGTVLRGGGSMDPALRRELFRQQIRQTILTHIERQALLRAQGIKVLSLFFIDRVASYRGSGDDAIVKNLFAEEFSQIRATVPEWATIEPEAVSAAYFAKDKSGAYADIDKQDQLKAEYALIMTEKEKLLSFDEPRCFVFAHSALREGWDNPNVFQICTLRETQSEMRKRQEIGRGLRICVDQSGNRVFDEDVNILTVIANASYESFCADLQNEFREEGPGIDPPPVPVNAANATIQRRPLVAKEADLLAQFWGQVAKRVTPQIHVDEMTLLREGKERLATTDFPMVHITRSEGRFVMHEVTLRLVAIKGYIVDFDIERVGSRVDDRVTERVSVHLDKPIVSVRIDIPELRGRVVTRIDARNELVQLSTGEEIYLDGSLTFKQRGVVQATEPGQREAVTVHYPIIDFPARVGSELQLSRAMIRDLFESIPLAQRERFLTNPEGFTSTFIETMRDVLRAHIVPRIRFTVHDDLIRTLDEVLPASMTAKQRELVKTPERALYPQTQKDSEEEHRFIEQLESDDEVILYFKFPLKYKIDFPEIIGNYNPDWAVIRRGPRNTSEVFLVRETKGTDDLSKLRFAHEKHVIGTAYRCFREMGIDYRVVRGTNAQWYQPHRDGGVSDYATSVGQE